MTAKRTRKPLVWALCLHATLIFSQTTFQKTFGGPGNEVGTWVIETTNGYLVAGHVTNNSGNQDALLIRLDPSGNAIWQKRFGGGQADVFNAVVETNGGFFAVGESRSFGAESADIFLVKVDAAGAVLWSKTIGGASFDDHARSVIAVPGGGFLVSGVSVAVGSTATNSIFTRLDQNGNTLWSRTYTSAISNILLSNYIDGNTIHASGGMDSEAAYLRLDLATGSILSSNAYAGSGNEALYYQQPTQDGNLVIADHTHSAPTGEDVELWVQKIKPATGQTLWSKVYYRANDNLRGRIERVNDGGFLLVPYDNFNTAQADALLAKIDANGNLQWSYNYGGNASDRLFKAVQTQDGGFVAVGDTRSSGANGSSDILLVKTKANGRIEGRCAKNAGIQSADFTANPVALSASETTWSQAAPLSSGPLPLNLLGQPFGAGAAPIILQNIPLCPNQSFTLGGVSYYAPKLVTDTLSNQFGCDTIYHYNLSVAPFITDIHVIGLCTDETYSIHGVQYTAPITILDTIPALADGCDTLYTFVLKLWAQPTASQTIAFCPGESVLIGGQAYTQPGTVQATIPSQTGGCDTLMTYTLLERPQPTRAIAIAFCPGESVIIGGNAYSHSATVVVNIPSSTSGCDTIVTYTLVERPQPTRATSIAFCPGESVIIGGNAYSQSATVVVNIPSSTSGCDTIVTYTLELRPQAVRAEMHSFCPGESVTIAGQTYTQSGTVTATLASGTGGCDTIVTHTLELRPQPTRAETRGFCAGESVTIGGQTYAEPGIVVANIASATGGCDTIVTYTLELRPHATRAETRRFCPGESVTIAGQTYTQAGTVTATLASSTGSCDTIVTYTLELRPQPTRAETRGFCPGESVTIAGQTYTQPGTVTATISSNTGGCDTIVTYTLELRPHATRAETRGFCPGESVTIAGQTYTQPGTVIVNLASPGSGCDTVVTYSLQHLTPAPSNVAIHCPNDVTIISTLGAGANIANYSNPVAASDCVCAGLELGRTSGLASGSAFPLGTTQVCYMAKDNCGQTAPCCFAVTVREDNPCDAKGSGCMKYELLSTTSDLAKNLTYRIRVTNNCSSKLIYTAIELPAGLTAMQPENNSTYTSPDGRNYVVRSPNYSPMYSVRFKSMADSIANGQSEVFEYTLPAQASVTYVNITSRLESQVFYEAHLNTFNCPVGVTPANRAAKARDAEKVENQNSLLLFPNPTTGVLFADLSNWQGQKLQVQVTNVQGQKVHSYNLTAEEDLLRVEMPQGLSNGVYLLEVAAEKGEKEVLRFMLQR
ncbi:MAG: T9SS type A sorting domain-containing protein [Saprospiraceae bacterium]